MPSPLRRSEAVVKRACALPSCGRRFNVREHSTQKFCTSACGEKAKKQRRK